MNIVSEYLFAIQSMGYRPIMERVAYYLLPVIPFIVFLINIVLAIKKENLKNINLIVPLAVDIVYTKKKKGLKLANLFDNENLAKELQQ